MAEHNLARLAEAAAEKNGDHESLWFEGEWHRADELFEHDAKWDADDFLTQLKERFPEGLAPEGMVAGMAKAGGRSLRSVG